MKPCQKLPEYSMFRYNKLFIWKSIFYFTTKIYRMNSSVFSGLCLICANYQCQEESNHQKLTFASMEALLAQYFIMEVSSKDNHHDSYRNEFFRSNNSKDFSRSQKTCLSPKKHSKHKNKFHEFLEQIQSVSFQSKVNKDSALIGLESLLMASMSTIYFIQTYKADPLLFHDISYVLKLAIFHKYNSSEKLVLPQNLPFTQSRINRAIRKIKQRILTKEKEIQKLKSKENYDFFQTNLSENLSNVFQDVTNASIQNRKSPKLVNNDCKMFPSFEKSKQRIILQDVLEQCFDAKGFLKKLKQIQEVSISSKNQCLKDFCGNILSQISRIQLIFIQKWQIYRENNGLSIKKGITKKCQKQNHFLRKFQTNAQKSAYPITMKQREIQQKDFSQQAIQNEYTFIEGVPFPSSRRSIDFSMFQITNQLFLTYLPALEKFKDLEEICIRKNNLSDLSYRIIKNIFPKLRSLDVRETRLSHKIVKAITHFKNLNILYISECQIQPISLIQICLNLSNLNVLYCDRMKSMEENALQKVHNPLNTDSDFRKIFQVMSLNLKKLIYLSIKGYFFSKHLDSIFRGDTSEQLSVSVSSEQMKELQIFKNIYSTLQKRHGTVEI